MKETLLYRFLVKVYPSTLAGKHVHAVRFYKVLTGAGVPNFETLVSKKEAELLAIRNIGKGFITKVNAALAPKGFWLGMTDQEAETAVENFILS